jgi:3-deoxy-D-manno-octulosonic-acid transferase
VYTFSESASICKKVKDIPVIKQFKDKSPLLIIGSSWNDDIKVLAPAINQLSQPLKYVIAPHEISEENILFIEKSFQKKCIRYSKAIGQSIPINQYDILIIDNIGMLSSIYQYGTFAYIGGGFGKGIHNILEAVTFGMPIFFGPQYKKFQEALDLIALKSAFSIHNTEDFFSKFTLLYNDEKLRNIIIEKNKEYITSNTGSSSKIIHHCQQYFHES